MIYKNISNYTLRMKGKEIIKAKEELANLYLILKIRKKEDVKNKIL